MARPEWRGPLRPPWRRAEWLLARVLEHVGPSDVTDSRLHAAVRMRLLHGGPDAYLEREVERFLWVA